MHIVNLRHPGYPDSSNIILTLQAADDPNGGIHAETLRLVGCVVSGNRWDGFLSITQEHAKPVVPDGDGVLRRKDYYFHLPKTEQKLSDDVIDRRISEKTHESWPLVARFADWEWPEDGLPEIWKLAAENIVREAPEARASAKKSAVKPSEACGLCGKEEEYGFCRLWDYVTEGERMIWERERSKISIAADLRSDYDSEDEDGSEAGEDDDSNGESADSDEKDTDANDEEDRACDSQEGTNSDENDIEDNDSGPEIEVGGAADSSEAQKSKSGSEDEGETKIPNPLHDNRNYVRLGRDCLAEPDHCDAESAFDRGQWLFVPKEEQDGRPVLCAHIFATREEGITRASHNMPLQYPWKSSIELMFAHFVQVVFEQVSDFFTAGVSREIQIISVDGRKVLLDATPEACAVLAVPFAVNMWPPEANEESNEDDESDASKSETEATEQADKVQRSTASEIKSSQSASEHDDIAEKAEPEMKEVVGSSEDFQAAIQELAEALAETKSEEDQEAQIPETVLKRSFPDILCDICDGRIWDVRYMCLDCEEYDLCSDCISQRSTEHPGHLFLAIHESGWREKVPTGRLVPKEGGDAVESTQGQSSLDAQSDKVGPTKADVDLSSHLITLLDTHVESGDSLHYSESLTETSPSLAKIRILHLWPGGDHMPIVGHLETVPLDASSSFEALSYCWGDPMPRRIINVSGARLEVGTNLKLALHRLRLTDRVRRMWIDGICINQSDDLEKTAQVTMMRRIYETAEQTIIWLGEEDANSRIALDLCNRMVEAHGVAYLRQSIGIDVEKLYTEIVADGDEAEMLNQDDIEQAMIASGKAFDLDLALVDHFTKVGKELLEGKTYEGPLNELVQQELARDELNQEDFWEDIGYRLAMGEEYDGPDKEMVYAVISEAMAELETGNEAQSSVRDAIISTISKQREEESTSEGLEKISHNPTVAHNRDSTQYHYRIISQILAARRRHKNGETEAEPPNGEEIAALHTVLQRPWFTRIWIVQEAGVSSQTLVQCGGQIIDWWAFSFGFLITQTIKRAARIGSKSHRNLVIMSSTRSSIHTASSLKSLMTKPDASLDLLSLLSMYRGYGATDPRDKVFALLGICNPLEGLKPDYTKTRDQVYQDVATVLLQHSTNLQLLASCHVAAGSHASQTSWVPDWHDLSRKPYKLAGDQNADSNETSTKPIRTFIASGKTTTTQLSFLATKLQLPGLIIDTITQVAPPLLLNQEDLLMPLQIANVDGADYSSLLTSMRRFFHVLTYLPSILEEWKSLAGVSDLTPTNEEQHNNLTVLSRTLWTDLSPPETCVTECTEWLVKLTHLQNLTHNLPDFANIAPTEENFLATILQLMPIISELDPNKLKTLHELGALHTLDRRLARTEAGRLALVPAAAEIGDDVGLLMGGGTPFVLREVIERSEEVRGEEYRLIGEAYVHGVMYGEAWDAEKCRRICLV